jgi:hypothetical protein
MPLLEAAGAFVTPVDFCCTLPIPIGHRAHCKVELTGRSLYFDLCILQDFRSIQEKRLLAAVATGLS